MKPLWEPSAERIANSNLVQFAGGQGISVAEATTASRELYEWSLRENHKFWSAVWDFCGVVAEEKGNIVWRPSRSASQIPRGEWFPEARLNFAENMLRYRDDRPAIIFWGEELQRRTLTFRELHAKTCALAHALKDCGVGPGDRVAGFMPHLPETIIAAFAAISLGAVWTACSPDFGVAGVLDRFTQISPKVLFTADGYFFKGESLDSLAKANDIAAQLPELSKVIVVPYTQDAAHLKKHARVNIPHAITLDDLIEPYRHREQIPFARLPFDHPLYILYSSGTTGKPKCIVHGAGGTLLEHLKELILHTNLTRNDRIIYQTTVSWMMWHWVVSALGVGATVALYDGAPFHRGGKILFDLAAQEKLTVFGTNAKFIASCQKEGLAPARSHDLTSIHTVLSTGSPLVPESFDYLYQSVTPKACVSSISGGTDIIGCFALGSPLLPVYRGELQTRSLGLHVDVFDENGRPTAGKGELVCKNPFPSSPVRFWGDDSNKKYFESYFARYPGVWCHGDYTELTERGGLIIYGRSDTVLNPGGIRIGTAEIYRQVEQFPEILESIVIGQDWKNDVRVVLFVRLAEGKTLDSELQKRIQSTIRKNLSPFHVPKLIIAVPDIPRTRSGKIVELAVRDTVNGYPVKNLEALANPEALNYFRNQEALTREP